MQDSRDLWYIRPLFLPSPGCFVSGLYLEGADWDLEKGCLIKSKPKVLVVDLPILKVIPIEAHRLKLQVTATSLLPGTEGETVLSVLVLLKVGCLTGGPGTLETEAMEPLPGQMPRCTGVCGHPSPTGIRFKFRSCGLDEGETLSLLVRFSGHCLNYKVLT
jgi:hypothetical protein